MTVEPVPEINDRFQNRFDIKDIISRINKLQDKQKIHILEILQTNAVEFTKNANGYFFNFVSLSDTVADKICKCLDLIEANTDLVREMDRRRNELLTYYKRLIEERLQRSILKRKNDYIRQLQVSKPECNINANIQRVFKIRRKQSSYVATQLAEDTGKHPDVMAKELLKRRCVYAKDGVYQRILTVIKTSQSKRSRVSNDADHDGPESSIAIAEGSIVNDDDDLDVGSIAEDIAEGGSIDDLEYGDVDGDVDGDDGSMELQDVDLDDVAEGSIEVLEEAEGFVEDIEDAGEGSIDVLDAETEMEILYYKNMLSKHGYEFDDNKRCFLVEQEYIY